MRFRGELFVCLLTCAVCVGDEQPVAEPPPSLKKMEEGPDRLDAAVNLRSRYEHMDNFTIREYGMADDDVLLLRTRVSLDYKVGEDASFGRLFAEAQDARYGLSRYSRGDFGRSSSYYDRLDLRQAFIELGDIAHTPFSVIAGRQIFRYGECRSVDGIRAFFCWRVRARNAGRRA